MKTLLIVTALTGLWSLMPTEAAQAQEHVEPEREITLVGCVMRESQYRDTYGPGLSGPRGPGIGGRNEYMLVDAREIAAGTPDVADAKACPAAPGTFPTAYELTGSREGSLDAFLNRRVEISGIRKEATVRRVESSGNIRPTGGFDPLGHELHLFEVEIADFREPTPALAEAPAVTPAPAVVTPAPAPPPVAIPKPEIAVAEPAPAAPTAPVEEPAPQVAATPPEEAVEPPRQAAAVPRTTLPRTASPLPLVGLFSFLSLAAAAGLHVYRGRGSRPHERS